MTNTKEIRAALKEELKCLEARTSAIHGLLKVYETPKPAPGAKLPALEMARTVIRNAGRQLAMKEILEGFRKTYGLTPPVNLVSILESRARENKGFFATDDGAIGAIEMLHKARDVENVQTSSQPRTVSAV